MQILIKIQFFVVVKVLSSLVFRLQVHIIFEFLKLKNQYSTFNYLLFLVLYFQNTLDFHNLVDSLVIHITKVKMLMITLAPSVLCFKKYINLNYNSL